MNKLGPIIAFVGFIVIFVSLIVAISAVPSNLPESDSLLISSLFEGMFDDISEPFQILPGNMVYTSYSTYISDVPLLWGIQIIDYQNGDKLSVSIENIFGDSYGTYVQSDSVLFERISVQQSDTLTLLEQGASSYDSSSPMGGQVEGESSLEHLKAKKESKESTLNDLRR